MSALDDRKAAALDIPIEEIAFRLDLTGLARQGVERIGPCPVCGGVDRFAINTRKGRFYCRQCTPKGGDGIALVELVLGCDFLAALSYLVGEAAIKIDPAEAKRRAEARARKQAEAEAYAIRAREHAINEGRRIFQAALPGKGTLAEAYLAARGIEFETWPPALRFLPDHPYHKRIRGQGQTWHSGPCLVAGVQSAEGYVTAAHQTWIDPLDLGQKAQIFGPDGEALPAKLVRGSKKGCAIRLTSIAGARVMVMGEGIETTGSAYAHGLEPGAAFWAGVDLGNMAGKRRPIEGQRVSDQPDLDDARAFVPPDQIRRLIYIQDGDSDPQTTRAQLLAGLRRARASNPAIETFILAADPGVDLNDMRREALNPEADR